jgi:hypothetical protein
MAGQKGFFVDRDTKRNSTFRWPKFVSFKTIGLEHAMPPFGVDQILDAGNGKMWLRQGNHIGLFDPISFHYSGVPINPKNQLPVQSELNLFSDSKGNTFLCTHKTGLLFYNKTENQITSENLPIRIPEGWTVNSLFEDTITGDYWICSDEGLAVYQSKTQTLISRNNNPQLRPIFEHNDLTFISLLFD